MKTRLLSSSAGAKRFGRLSLSFSALRSRVSDGATPRSSPQESVDTVLRLGSIAVYRVPCVQSTKRNSRKSYT